MARLPHTPYTAAEVATRAAQGDHDQAALFLIRRAIQLEASAVRAGDKGSVEGERNKMRQARAFRAAARRLVLTDRPPLLGVPMWLDAGTVETNG